jgi:hypothetical protein
VKTSDSFFEWFNIFYLKHKKHLDNKNSCCACVSVLSWPACVSAFKIQTIPSVLWRQYVSNACPNLSPFYFSNTLDLSANSRHFNHKLIPISCVGIFHRLPAQMKTWALPGAES